MNFDQVIQRMNLYTISTIKIHDLAVSAEKLMSWDEKAWKTKPRLSTGANRKNLSRKVLPLCLEISTEMSMTISLLHGNKPSRDKNPLYHTDEFVPIDEVIATQVILYNYCLLEEYEFYQYNKVLQEKIFDISNDKFTLKDFMNRGYDVLTNGVIEKEQKSYERKGPLKRIRDWEKLGISALSDDNLSLYEKLSSRRNELTHVSDPEPPTLEESVVFFHGSRLIAKEIAISFSDSSVDDCE